MRDLLTPIWLLLKLRWKLAVRAQARSSVTQIGVALALLVFVPAANAAGGLCYRQMRALPPAHLQAGLTGVLLDVQGLWLALILAAGAAGLSLSRATPLGPLRMLPARPGQVVFAGALGALLDVPSLLVLPVLIAIGRAVGSGDRPAAATATAVAGLGLFALQTAAGAQLAGQAGVWLVRRQRRLPVIAGVLLAGALGTLMWPTLRSLSPPAVTSAALLHGGRGEWIGWGFAAALLSAGTAGCLWGAARLLAENQYYPDGTAVTRRRRRDRRGSLHAGWRLPVWAEPTALVAASEWRLLFGDPGRHLPLRAPAVMLLLGAFVWIVPDLGPDVLRNGADLAAMGGIAYVALWQIQLLCNRFGTESGTAALLFGFPHPRPALLLGRNAALLALLVLLDGAGGAAGCLAAHASPAVAAAIAEWLVPILILMTAIGNVASVTRPFPIRPAGERFAAEPEVSVATAYGAQLGAAWALVTIAGALASAAHITGWAPWIGLLIALAVYAATLLPAARLLTVREEQMVRALDGRW